MKYKKASILKLTQPNKFELVNLKTRRGTNGYEKKFEGGFNFKLLKGLSIILMLSLTVIYMASCWYVNHFIWQPVSPIGLAYAAHEKVATPSATLTLPSASPTPTQGEIKTARNSAGAADGQQEAIKADIKQVFGKYSDKAFLLLQGNGTPGACHENGKLNPKARNENVFNGVVDSTDYGIFQINNKWQRIDNTAFLYDPAINVRIAWNIFKNSGMNFSRWTCGKYYHI